MNIVIKPVVSDDDISSVVDIQRKNDFYYYRLPGIAEMVIREKVGGVEYYFITKSNKVIGFYGTSHTGYIGLRGFQGLRLQLICLNTKYRNKGIGTYVLDYLKGQDIDYVEVDINPSKRNFHRLCHYYNDRGFTKKVRDTNREVIYRWLSDRSPNDWKHKSEATV